MCTALFKAQWREIKKNKEDSFLGMITSNCIFLSAKHLVFEKQEQQHPKLSVEGDIIIGKRFFIQETKMKATSHVLEQDIRTVLLKK